jgi:hypothetical protein
VRAQTFQRVSERAVEGRAFVARGKHDRGDCG